MLLIALGVGVATFTLIDGDPGSDLALDSRAVRSPNSSPTVLGSTITAAPAAPAAPTAPTAGAAAPATFELAVPSPEVRRTPATIRPRRPTRSDAAPATTASTTSTAPPPTLGPPWSIENTTTTTTEVTTTTEATTTTTEDPTSTTSATSVPEGT